MLVEAPEFVEKVRRLYLADPARVSSIPFWKLEGFLLQSRTYEVVQGVSRYLYALRGNQLVFYWSDDTSSFLLPEDEMRSLDFFVLHEDFYGLVRAALGEGYQATPAYTLLYDFAAGSESPEAGRYYVDSFDFGSDAEYGRLAGLINATDSSFRLTAEKVKQWTKTPAFDPALWIWVRSRDAGDPVAIAVSNHYETMRETDLDWFYVLPEHQRHGLGGMLVRETIDRSRSRSDIIRLSGVADEFYMKCGFRRKDLWHVIRRNKDAMSGDERRGSRA